MGAAGNLENLYLYNLVKTMPLTTYLGMFYLPPYGNDWGMVYYCFNHITSFFPTCQVRVVRFYVRCPAPPSFLLPSSPDLISALDGSAGSQLPALDSSGPRRTSFASS